MKRTILQFSILTFLLILQASPVMADTAGADKFTVLYSNNVNGETAPCG